MSETATIAAIYRYPVKGLSPQALARIVRVLGAAYELFGDRELLHVLDGFAQKGRLFANRFDERDAHLWKSDLERQAGHAATAANVDQAQRLALTQPVE